MKRILIFTALATLAGITGAETVKICEAANGKTTWTNQECPTGTKEKTVQVAPNVADSRELRAWARRNPKTREISQKTAAAPQQPYINPVDCENAERMYRFESGYKFTKPGEIQRRYQEVISACGRGPRN